jgi:hypothetical protein
LRESRSRELRRDRGEPRPRALVDSFNLYFGEFHEGQELAKNLEDIEALFGTESYFKAKINPYGVIFEFGRQLAQLREADSSTETTFTKFARRSFTSCDQGNLVHNLRSCEPLRMRVRLASTPGLGQWVE